MDRNISAHVAVVPSEQVALRKESVDRNISREISLIRPYASLSARRAWIEIPHAAYAGITLLVALRKESVDRNGNHVAQLDPVCKSLSARRAWIEINNVETAAKASLCRSPQGERG